VNKNVYTYMTYVIHLVNNLSAVMLNEAKNLRPRPRPKPRGRGRDRGQFLEVEAKAEARNNYEEVPNSVCTTYDLRLSPGKLT